jgi:hypothetical protein
VDWVGNATLTNKIKTNHACIKGVCLSLEGIVVIIVKVNNVEGLNVV